MYHPTNLETGWWGVRLSGPLWFNGIHIPGSHLATTYEVAERWTTNDKEEAYRVSLEFYGIVEAV